MMFPIKVRESKEFSHHKSVLPFTSFLFIFIHYKYMYIYIY